MTGYTRATCSGCKRQVVVRRSQQTSESVLIDALPRVGGDLVLLADGVHYRRLELAPDDGRARYVAHRCDTTGES